MCSWQGEGEEKRQTGPTQIAAVIATGRALCDFSALESPLVRARYRLCSSQRQVSVQAVSVTLMSCHVVVQHAAAM